jgi:pyrimidine-nucleoside phosphorylase
MGENILRPQDIIRKKRDGGILSRKEIEYFVNGVAREELADYQTSALLMAIFLKGMNEVEQLDLTEAMLYSGKVLDFTDISKPKSDKHSTGGVGDKTSLVIAPLAAASGLAVPMISGRGLGHTGGTLDKLESIPGYRVTLTLDEFRAVLERVGFAMMGQTADLAPADRKLYALRDATSTVEAIPLIVASIMSKKLAAGLNSLVLDVKTGSGAFMREEGRARELARALVNTGNAFGVKTQALITDMNQPLGHTVGNALEVLECVRILQGETTERSRPVKDLSLELTARMVLSAGLEVTIEKARSRVLQALDSGSALEKLRANVEAQGGNPRLCDDPTEVLDLTAREVRVESPIAGFVTAVNAFEIGNAVASLGGGRVRIEDSVDPAVGFASEVVIGDPVEAGDTLGFVYCRDISTAGPVLSRIQSAYSIGEAPPSNALELIKEVIEA